jgi:hypothetical protein
MKGGEGVIIMRIVVVVVAHRLRLLLTTEVGRAMPHRVCGWVWWVVFL